MDELTLREIGIGPSTDVSRRTFCPLRSTVTRSARLKISSSRCDTYRMPAPEARRSRMILNRRSTSPGGRTAVARQHEHTAAGVPP